MYAKYAHLYFNIYHNHTLNNNKLNNDIVKSMITKLNNTKSMITLAL